MMDDIALARKALDDAAGARMEIAERLVARAHVHATIAIAEALGRLADRSRAVEATERQTITVDLVTGEWLTPDLSITNEEAERVASSVLPGTSPELVAGWYSAWLSNDPARTPTRAHDVIGGYL